MTMYILIHHHQSWSVSIWQVEWPIQNSILSVSPSSSILSHPFQRFLLLSLNTTFYDSEHQALIMPHYVSKPFLLSLSNHLNLIHTYFIFLFFCLKSVSLRRYWSYLDGPLCRLLLLFLQLTWLNSQLNSRYYSYNSSSYSYRILSKSL